MNHCAVVLAAGEGTRMQMPGAKVLLPVLGKPMIDWVIGAVLEAGVDDCCLIVGKDLEQVRARVGDGVCYALQLERKGTGHAVRQAEDFLRAHSGGHCLVLAGDSPLISGGTIRRAGRMLFVRQLTIVTFRDACLRERVTRVPAVGLRPHRQTDQHEARQAQCHEQDAPHGRNGTICPRGFSARGRARWRSQGGSQDGAAHLRTHGAVRGGDHSVGPRTVPRISIG